ncbi:unnamed protein product [Calicophoron daubneyi]|uniref:Anaphase-promoting complex subunit CDC26 n=1 Tax=Calicophoron daubneyi TaxID=300641 RepID=A0AAV2TB52_CALDB
MQRRPLTRIELGLQDVVEFKKFMDAQKPSQSQKPEDHKSQTDLTNTSEKDRRKQTVRHRIA